MIKKVVDIGPDQKADDTVELNWFDIQKPNLSAITGRGVAFIIKTKFTHLHTNDVLVCEEGYTIKVRRAEDKIYELHFSDALYFAKIAYEIGNRHQPICVEPYKITVLRDISLNDIIHACMHEDSVTVKQIEGYFKPNGKAHHTH